MSVLLNTCTHALEFLNKDLVVVTTPYGEDVTDASCGLKSLIDDIISNLVAIKNDIKKNERLIEKDIEVDVAAMAAAGSSTLNLATRVLATVTVTVANIHNSTEITARSEDATDNKNPAVLTLGTDKYSEGAVFAAMENIWAITARLKNGTFGPHGNVKVEGEASDGGSSEVVVTELTYAS